MKKFYESPKSLTIVIGLHGRLLENVVSQGDDEDTPSAREQKNNWNDDWDDTNN